MNDLDKIISFAPAMESIAEFSEPSDIISFLSTSKIMASLDTTAWWKVYLKRYFPHLIEPSTKPEDFNHDLYKNIFLKVQKEINEAFDLQKVTGAIKLSISLKQYELYSKKINKLISDENQVLYYTFSEQCNLMTVIPERAFYCAFALSYGHELPAGLSVQELKHANLIASYLACIRKNFSYLSDPDLNSALFSKAACLGHFAVVQALSVTDATLQQALIVNAKMGHAKVVKALLALDWTDLQILTKAKNEALICAASYGFLEVMEVLLAAERPDALISIEAKKVAFKAAVYSCQLKVMKFFLALEQITGLFLLEEIKMEVLSQAAMHGEVDIIELLLDPELRGTLISAEAKENAFKLAAYNDKTDVIQALLASEQRGELISEETKGEALSQAAAYGNLNAVKFLLTIKWFDFKLLEQAKGNALKLAIRARKLDVFQFLLDSEQNGVLIPEKDKKWIMEKAVSLYFEKFIQTLKVNLGLLKSVPNKELAIALIPSNNYDEAPMLDKNKEIAKLKQKTIVFRKNSERNAVSLLEIKENMRRVEQLLDIRIHKF